MKKILLALLSIVAIMSACNKTTPAPVAPIDPVSPYYFTFTTNAGDYNLNADFKQYMPFDNNAIGGYQIGKDKLLEGPSAGIRLSWPLGDTVREKDVKNLIGKTLYFNDTTIAPEISFTESISSDTWYSVDTPDRNFFIKITNVTYLKDDEGIDGVPLKTYVLKGNCNAILYLEDKIMPFSNGAFNIVISRRDW